MVESGTWKHTTRFFWPHWSWSEAIKYQSFISHLEHICGIQCISFFRECCFCILKTYFLFLWGCLKLPEGSSYHPDTRITTQFCFPAGDRVWYQQPNSWELTDRRNRIQSSRVKDRDVIAACNCRYTSASYCEAFHRYPTSGSIPLFMQEEHTDEFSY